MDTPTGREILLSELATMRGALEADTKETSAMRVAVQENTKATSAMSAAIRMIYLVPLALAAMAMVAYLLQLGKISEATFVTITLACLSPFFGEGIGRVLERFPIVGRKAADVASRASILVFAGGCAATALLAGCTLTR
jgi:hypothetical protein